MQPTPPHVEPDLYTQSDALKALKAHQSTSKPERAKELRALTEGLDHPPQLSLQLLLQIAHRPLHNLQKLLLNL